MYSVVDVDVDIVQKIVILVPVSAPFTLKTLGLRGHDMKLAEAMFTPRRKCRRPAMVTPKSYPYP